MEGRRQARSEGKGIEEGKESRYAKRWWEAGREREMEESKKGRCVVRRWEEVMEERKERG